MVSREDSLYVPYREGMGEAAKAAVRIVVALADEWASLE
jgi:hypothetical protein